MNKIYLFLLLIINGFSVQATNWYVNDNDLAGDVFTSAVGSVLGDGTAASPFDSFSKALAAASSGDIIYIDAGLYVGETFHNINLTNLSIIGAGTDRTLIDNELASSNSNYFALITANGVNVNNIRFSQYNNVGNSFGQKILAIDGATSVTLTNLQLDNSSPAGGGAALIIANGSEVDIVNGSYTCNADNSNTTNFNGAIGVESGSSLSIDGALIHNNGSTQRGGGISVVSGADISITNCTFTENIGGYGGAVCVQGPTSGTCNLTISGCWFEDNQANTGSSIWSGGAIAIGESVNASITNCMFKNNSASGGSGSSDGGAISVEDAVNTADGGSTTLNIMTCTFDGNTAANDGKAIYADERGDAIAITIDNCTFLNHSSNYAIAQRSSGEAAFTIQDSGSPTVESSALSPGPGIVNTNAPSTTTTASKITADGNCPAVGQDLSGLLPVVFQAFNVEKRSGKSVLRWTTAQEISNKGFYIQHSTTAKTWMELSFVQGNGNSSEENTYQFIHENPTQGINYYRLLQEDFDGSASYSSIHSVQMNDEWTTNPHIRLYPNPTNGSFLNIIFNQPLQESTVALFYDQSGKMVQQFKLEANASSSILNVADFRNGIYFVQIISAELPPAGFRWIKN